MGAALQFGDQFFLGPTLASRPRDSIGLKGVNQFSIPRKKILRNVVMWDHKIGHYNIS